MTQRDWLGEVLRKREMDESSGGITRERAGDDRPCPGCGQIDETHDQGCPTALDLAVSSEEEEQVVKDARDRGISVAYALEVWHAAEHADSELTIALNAWSRFFDQDYASIFGRTSRAQLESVTAIARILTSAIAELSARRPGAAIMREDARESLEPPAWPPPRE